MTDNTAQERFTQLDQGRSVILDRVREAAELTIPALMPPEGHTEQSDLPTPYQSIGSRGVNNLASKLLLSLLPPSQSFFRLRLDEKALQALTEAGADRGKIDTALRNRENVIMRFIERGNLRPMLFAALKQLVVTGNAVLYLPKSGESQMYRLDQYVVVRDPAGTVTELLIKESAHPKSLPEEVIEACDVDTNDDKKSCDIFTRVWLERPGFYKWAKEINETTVPGSEGQAKKEDLPWLVLRWQAVENEDYGRGLVEEYLGDLRSHDGMSKAILSFSAVAAKIIFLVKPNSTTNPKELSAAESGDFKFGDEDDISILGLEKFNDFRVTKEVLDELTLRLSHAFLLQSGTVRDAERVTAEEIREMAQELEDVLGGVYTVQTQELQLPLVRRIMSILRGRGELKALPSVPGGKPSEEPQIVTGFDALGRTHELNRLRAMLGDLVNVKPDFAQRINDTALAQKFATAYNVDIEGLILDDQQMAQKMAGQQQAAMAEKAAGPVAGAVAKAATEGNQGGSNG